MKNQVIKNLNPEMGKEIIKYFQSLGIDTKNYTGSVSEQDYMSNIYYGVIDNNFSNYFPSDIKRANAEIIELPILPKRGDRILVWDYNESTATERTFLTFITGAHRPVIVVDLMYERNYKKGEPFFTSSWSYWKPISKEEIIELTLEDISNGRGVGVKPELIRIKK